MNSLLEQIKQAFAEALTKIDPSLKDTDPMIRLTTDRKFGDYQSNVAMGLAKKLKKNPREVAQQVIDALDVADMCEKTDIAGPGFINVFLRPSYLAQTLAGLNTDDHLGVAQTQQPLHHIIDFSSPNLAKEMHVGHLRTTITGEVIARVIEFMGHTIERVNHVGDWGTQFGMLLQYIFENHPEVLENPDAFHVKDLETFYKKAKKNFDENDVFATEARKKVVLLQSEDPTAMTVWKAFVKESLRHCHEIYDLLDVSLTDIGESFYNTKLPGVVSELKENNMACEDKGAVCVFLDGFTNREGDPLPMIIQKTDGGYNYDTTDLAAIKYRIQDCGGKRLIYVTDIRQAQHFTMLFVAARKAGWATQDVILDHVGYGMVLGSDRKPFKTRDGGTVRLRDLIEEGVARAKAMITENREGAQLERVQSFSEEKINNIANAVGLAAIKYSDLSHNLASDYVFSWDKMLAMDGNTGPYMLYAYARIRSIGRKGGVDFDHLPKETPMILEHPAELALAKILVRFSDVVANVIKELKPNLLTDYLYSVSKGFSSFYDKKLGVSVLDAESDDLKMSRLLLCSLTAKTLKAGLYLLGITVVEEM
ncbi:MAG: arginine--tRNA ligase [bacterium]|nr:arginine--tRNA ligase [bacterium]MBU1917947.1 arginine--tRNA ligase [bacterium]